MDGSVACSYKVAEAEDRAAKSHLTAGSVMMDVKSINLAGLTACKLTLSLQ